MLTAEPALSKLESAVSVLVKRIVRDEELSFMSEEDQLNLSTFLAVQFVRTKEHRLRFDHLTRQTKRMLVKRGATEEQADELFDLEQDPNNDKVFGLKAIESAKEFIPAF